MTKVKKPPVWLNNRLLIRMYQSKPGVLFSNWLAQCMLYSESVEVLFRLVLELTILLVLVFIYWCFASLGLFSLICIILISHTITFFINGHFFNVVRFLGLAYNEPLSFIEYPDTIKKNLEGRSSICALVMFGSLSRERFSTSSDLDLRVIACDGFNANFAACFWTFYERFRALLNKYPIDVYVVTKYKGLEKLRSDEPPIVLFDKDKFISNHYDKYHEYENFKKAFIKKYHKFE